MKLFNKIFLLFAASCLLFVACEDEDDFTPGPAVEGQGYFFSSELASSYTLSLTTTSIEVVLGRSESSGTATAYVSSTVTTSGEDASSLFDIPSSASFADGELSTSFDITFDAEELGYVTYSFVLELTEETTPYGSPSYEFTVGVTQPWVTLGMATYCDYFYFDNSYQVELQQNEAYPNKFRLIDPYVQGLIDEGYMTDPPTDNDLNFMILETGKTYAEQTGNSWYDDMVITLEDLVCFEPINPGWFYDSYASYVWLYHPSYWSNWPDEEDWIHSCVLEYDDEGLPSIVQLAPMYYLSEYGAYWNYTTYDEVVLIYFPGTEVVEPADYSVEVEYTGKYTDADDNESILADVTMGADVEYTAVVITEGSDPTSALYGILLDTVEYQTVTEDGTVTFDAPTEDGYYTVLAVSYGDEDYQYYDWDTFFYSAGGGSVDPWVVETTGDYSFSGFYYEGTDTGLILYSNSYDDTLYKIADWGAGVDFTFNWDKDTNELYVQDQQTGEAYGSYGDVYVCDLTDYFPSLAPYGGTGYYSDGTFYFAVGYYCGGGDFGYGFEAFKTKGGEFGVALSDVQGSYYAFEYNAPTNNLYAGDYVIEESDDPSLGNIMFTLFDDADCNIASIYGTYDEETGIAEFENDQIFGISGAYYLGVRNYSFYRYYPITMRFFNDGAFWGPFFGDYLEIGGYTSSGNGYTHAGYFYAYGFMYGWKEEAEPSSIKPTSVTKRSVSTELANGELKSHINFTKKPVKNSAIKPASVAPVEWQNTACQPVKKDAKKVVAPTPGAPTHGTK